MKILVNSLKCEGYYKDILKVTFKYIIFEYVVFCFLCNYLTELDIYPDIFVNTFKKRTNNTFSFHVPLLLIS